MGFELRNRWHILPSVWLLLSVAFAFATGLCFASDNILWVLFGIGSVACGWLMVRSVISVNKRMRYVMEATLNGDFSYKFPTENVNRDEREINEVLNSMVSHFEMLTSSSRRNEVFLERVINLTDIGLAVADSRGEIILHNEAVLRILDRPVLTHVCQFPEQVYSDFSVKRSEWTVEGRGFTLFTFSDLSRQMQAVEVESWEKLTRVLTHEIMNSLTPIRSIAETMLVKMDASRNRDVREAFETIASSSGSLMQFVKNFREFTKLPEPRMRALYLKPLLESCVRMGEEYVNGEEIEISLLCFPPELMVYTDESLLSRVLLNIIKNAIEASPKRIMIEADLKADESVEIRISNDGEPISEEAASQIFTPFFTTRPSGSGIGLSLSRRLITHLGGTLTFKTTPLTTFSIRL